MFAESCDLLFQAERAAAAREAEQRAREQAEAAGSGVDQEGSAQPAEASHTVEDTRPTGSGRFQGPPPGTTRNPGAPPSGSGRGQGRGASLDAANGRLSVPPGMEVSREEHGGRGGRGRRGRVSPYHLPAASYLGSDECVVSAVQCYKEQQLAKLCVKKASLRIT